jgi:hypothetical protein
MTRKLPLPASTMKIVTRRGAETLMGLSLRNNGPGRRID